ncbi:hypothetical protein BpHYR1_011928, partial [Brachionus plicatilis]
MDDYFQKEFDLLSKCELNEANLNEKLNFENSKNRIKELFKKLDEESNKNNKIFDLYNQALDI